MESQKDSVRPQINFNRVYFFASLVFAIFAIVIRLLKNPIGAGFFTPIFSIMLASFITTLIQAFFLEYIDQVEFHIKGFRAVGPLGLIAALTVGFLFLQRDSNNNLTFYPPADTWIAFTTSPFQPTPVWIEETDVSKGVLPADVVLHPSIDGSSSDMVVFYDDNSVRIRSKVESIVSVLDKSVVAEMIDPAAIPPIHLTSALLERVEFRLFNPSDILRKRDIYRHSAIPFTVEILGFPLTPANQTATSIAVEHSNGDLQQFTIPYWEGRFYSPRANELYLISVIAVDHTSEEEDERFARIGILQFVFE